MSHAVGVIKKLQLVFPKTILLTIYNALILPHFIYCLLSWGSANAVKTIFTIQKRAIRAISSAGYNAHTEPGTIVPRDDTRTFKSNRARSLFVIIIIFTNIT